MTKRGTPEEWFWQKVKRGNDCWEWTGARQRPSGYGLHRFHGIQRLTHRISWEMAHGPVPPGLCVLHRCDNPPCINPAHLWLGTHGDNARDAFAKGRRKTPVIDPVRRARGSRSGTAKLNETIVAIIKERLRDGATHVQLARMYGVSASSIGRIAQGRWWRHVA